MTEASWADPFDDEAERRPSTRWLALKRAWRTTGHLRVCLSAIVIAFIFMKAYGPRWGLPRPVEAALSEGIVLAFLGLGILVAVLMVFLLLALIQVITGRTLDDLDRWQSSLPWWAQGLAGPLLILVVSVPAVVLAILFVLVAMSIAVG